jgi:hypothetical protein
VLAVLSVLAPGNLIGSGTFLTALGILLVAVPAWSCLRRRIARSAHGRTRPWHRSGCPQRCGATGSQHDYPYRVVGFVDDPATAGTDLDMVGATSELSELMYRKNVDRVVEHVRRRGRMPIREPLQAKMSGVRVEDAATIYERLTGRSSSTTSAELVDFLRWFPGVAHHAGHQARRRPYLAAGTLRVTTDPAHGSSRSAPNRRAPCSTGRNVSARTGGFSRCSARCVPTQTGTPIWAKENDDRVTRVGRFIRSHVSTNCPSSGTSCAAT